MKKGLKITGIVVLVLFIFLLIAPFLFKGKIIQAIKTTANKELNATLDFDNDIGLSFIRSFPNVSLGIDQLSVVGKDSFQGDTLVYIPKLRLVLDLMSAIKGDQIKIRKVFLKNPLINLETLPSGRANWDIAKADTAAKPADTASGTFNLSLKLLEIESGKLVYNDRSLGFYTEIQSFDHTSKGDFSSDNFTLETATKTPSLTLGYGGVNWLYHIQTVADATLGMDMKNMKFTFDAVKVKLNDLEVQTEGFVDMNENDMDMDIRFKALQNTFKSFLSLVPGIYQENFKDIKTSGSLSFNGFMKGKMTDDKMPATNVNLQIENGSFQYPSLPYAADNIFLKLKYDNPDGLPDNSVIDISSLKLRMAGEPIDMRLLLKTPVSDPYIDGAVKGKIDLTKIAGLAPLKKGTKLSGLVDADVSAKGNYSAVTNNNFDRLNATGKIMVNNLLYQTPADKDAYEVSKLSMEFTPKTVNLPACEGKIGKNDFNISGTIDNLLGYSFHDELLQAKVNFKSNYFNANSFMSDEETVTEPKASDTGQIGIVELPSNIDATFNASIGKLIYDNYILTDVGGVARMHDAKLDMTGLHAGFLGGEIGLDGTYDSKNVKNPFTSLNTSVKRLNMGSTFSYFPMMAKFAPIAKYVEGMFNATIDMSSVLDAQMQPNYNSMNVNGAISFTNAALTNVDFLKQIASQLKVSWLNNLQLKNQTIRFAIKEGVLNLLDSMVLPLGQGATMKLAGTSKLDQTINMGGWLKIPRKALGQGNNVLDGWVKQAAGKGWDLKVADMIPVDLAITGTFLKPKVSLSLQGMKEAFVDNIKDQGKAIVTEEANKQIGKGLEEAQAQADKILAEAKRNADRIRAEGKSAADKVRNEAKVVSEGLRKQGDDAYARIMAETETAAKRAESQVALPALKKAAGDRVRQEGKKKAEAAKGEFYLKAKQSDDVADQNARRIENEANKNADAAEKKAQDEADKIMAEARKKGKL